MNRLNRALRLSAATLVSLAATVRAGPAATAAADPTTAPAAATSMTFHNPIKRDGADPWMTWFDGNYYLSTTTGSDIRLRVGPSLKALSVARDVQVWREPKADERAHNVWAAEFHRFSGAVDHVPRWYCYYTANDGRDDGRHRMFVLESAGDDPMGPYVFKAQLRTDPDDRFYAIDGHPFVNAADGAMYFLWCGRPSPAGQGLYISKMSNPWTLTGNRVYIPASGFGDNVPVREGPETLQRDGKVYLIYSSSPADTPDYKLGLLIADGKRNLLDPGSWKQYLTPVFQRDDDNKVYGPGHNYFFTSPDGTQDWIVYHAKGGTEHTYRDRSTRAQPFTWTPDGMPDFGTPLPVTTDIDEPSGTPTAK